MVVDIDDVIPSITMPEKGGLSAGGAGSHIGI